MSLKISFFESIMIYLVSGHKLVKNGPIWRGFEKLKFAVKQCYQTDQLQNSTKIGKNAKIQVRHFV